MSSREDQVEQIVHAVLARLSKHAARDSADATHEPAKSGGNAELVLRDNVISAATLADRLTGVQRVVVPARAVVTPSARDLLKDKNVTLVRALKTAAAATVRLALGVAAEKCDAADLVRLLTQRGIEVQRISATGLPQVTSALEAEVGGGEKIGVLLTDNVLAALCLANRHRGVRAATASNRGELNEAIKTVGVNLLVIDSRRRSKSEVLRLIEAFVAAPAAQCPVELKSALE